jgi:hypothetical protein
MCHSLTLHTEGFWSDEVQAQTFEADFDSKPSKLSMFWHEPIPLCSE